MQRKTIILEKHLFRTALTQDVECDAAKHVVLNTELDWIILGVILRTIGFCTRLVTKLFAFVSFFMYGF